jgi:hypothetical protein
MATAGDFITHVDKVDGVDGCLLVRDDGVLLGQTIDDPEIYSTLLVISGGRATEVMDSAGFSYCRHLSFNRTNKQHFYVFPIDKFLLGVAQRPDCYVPDMLESVYRLIGRVSTSPSAVPQKEAS